MTGAATHCPICKAERTDACESAAIPCNVRAHSGKSFAVWRCAACRSIHAEDPIDLAPFYRGYFTKDEMPRFAMRAVHWNLLRILKRRGLRREHSILDLGCGKGHFLRFLTGKGYSVVGHDEHIAVYNSPTALEATYDVVLSQDVLEHFEDIHEGVAVHRGLVKPGGILAIGTPNADELELKASGRHLHALHQPYHRHIYSERAVVSLFEAAGCELISIHRRTHYDTPLPPVNARFAEAYLASKGDILEAAFERLDAFGILTSPRLVFLALFGYFLRCPGSAIYFFRPTCRTDNGSLGDDRQKSIAPSVNGC